MHPVVLGVHRLPSEYLTSGNSTRPHQTTFQRSLPLRSFKIPISANEISERVTVECMHDSCDNALSELTLPNVKFVLVARDVVRMEKW